VIPWDNDHIPSQLWNNTISLHNDIFEYHSSLLMSQAVIVIDNHRSGLHLLQRSWMLLLLINPCSSIFAYRLDVHRSAESSAVGLEALRCEQCRFCCRLSCIALRAMLVVRWQLVSLLRFFSLHLRFLTLPSTEAGQTLPPRLHTLLIYIHRSAVWPFAHCTVQWLRLCSHCTVAMLVDLQRLHETFWHSFHCIVVF